LGGGIESHPKTTLKYLHIALTAVATVHIGRSAGYRLNMAERPHFFKTTITRKKAEKVKNIKHKYLRILQKII
jgi:hypothetical protein